MVSRAKGRSGVWRVAALLAGALTQLAVSEAFAQRPGFTSTYPGQATGMDKQGESRGLAARKLAEARGQLDQGNLDGAERLAGEAARMNLSWGAKEDSPSDILHAVREARNDPKSLLKAARFSLAQKDYLRAEKYARLADRQSSVLSFTPWGDSPRKVLEDVQRAQQASPAVASKPGDTRTPPVVQTSYQANGKTPPTPAAPTAQAMTTPATPAGKTASDQTEEARQVIKQAREALTKKDYERAQMLAGVARGMKAKFGWWEDNPDRIEADVRRNGGARVATNTKPAQAAPSTRPTPPTTLKESTRTGATTTQTLPSTPNATAQAQPKGIVPTAAVSATTPSATPAPEMKPTTPPARTTASTAAPTPTKSAVSIPKTKDEARGLLALGRKQLAEGKLEDAAQTAQRIKAQPHLSYGLFEDSPDRLALDIDKARGLRDRGESIRLLSEGRKLYEKGDYENASRMAYRAQKLHGNYSIWDLGDRPSKLLADIQSAQARSRRTALPPATVAKRDEGKSAPTTRNGTLMGVFGSSGEKQAPTQVATAKPTTPAPIPGATTTPTATLPPVPGTTMPPATQVAANIPPQGMPSPDRLRAQQLVAEAQRLHREGKFTEASQKALEAQKLGVRFGQDETSPEFVYQQIAMDVRHRIDGLLRQSQNSAAEGKHQEAFARLQEARTLASTFGQDARPIESHLTTMTAAKPTTPAVAQATPTPTLPPPVPSAPVGQPSPGQQMLENARVELSKGETANARRLAETALTGNPEVRDEAMAMLRTIDAEEFNQKRLGANRAFDAALAAYRRREYSRASAMIAALDTRLLDAERQGRLREMSQTPEMSPGGTRVATATQTPNKGVIPAAGTTGSQGVVQTAGNTTSGSTGLMPVGGQDLPPVPRDGLPGKSLTPVSEGPGRALVSDSGDGGLMDRHKQMQKVLFEKLRQDGLEVQREAADKFRAGQTEQAMEMLQDYMVRLTEEKLEPGQMSLLKRPVESRLSHFRLLKAQKDLASGAVASKQASHDKVAARFKAEEMKQKNVEKLMKDFNTLFKEGKYLEAESLAMRALELDPDNGVASAAVYMARRQRDVTAYRKIKDGRERMNLTALNDAENEPGADAVEKGVSYDQERWKEANKRKPIEPLKIGRTSEKEKAIQSQLSTPISISFDSTPLKQVLEELRDVHGINIVPDMPAMQEAGVSVESPISIKLDRVSLKSALNLILHQVRLTHVIKDEVLMITTEENAKGKLATVSYAVADLVIPIENFGDVRNPGMTGGGFNSANYTQSPIPTPVAGPQAMLGGAPVGQAMGPATSMLNGNVPPTSSASTANSAGNVQATKRSANNTTEEQLMKLITSTIQPRSWSEMGGPGTVDYFPLTMSLVINQTPDIQEQIQDLLNALRRLQDQEVAVEVRFISVSEDFFERVGVNFNMNILTHNQRFEPALNQNAFVMDNSQFINAFRPGRFLAGMTPAGTLTPTLDIPITNNTFFQTIPNFGGYTTGGLSMGLAFLSDIQVFLFLEAAQGDQRANVMQAPKLTLFNGQTATLNVFDTQSFVQGVQVLQLAGGQYGMAPIISPVPSGVQLTIQAVISADRRFVRLSLAPTMNNLLPGPIQAFPVVVPIFTSIEGNQAGQPVVFTQYIQQPAVTNVSVQTTVAVPDGGTVLMGGLKRLSEARSEFGPPIFSKVPYINRLFKNVGYGRETDSMLIMVTPRIIIQAEEEERQTGFISATANVGL
ncbi:MAG: hypothetical protein U0840_20265 [Gemmataceae bacterium]